MNFIDCLKAPGPAAIGPLKCADGSEVFYACWNGAPLLKLGQWEGSSFSTEAEALEAAIAIGKHHGLTPGPTEFTIEGLGPALPTLEAARKFVDSLTFGPLVP